MTPQRVIGVDVGGTKILAGAIERDGTVTRRHELATPVASQEELLAGVEGAVAAVFGDDVAAIGIGVPSVVDAATGAVLSSNNIPLQDVSIGALLSERFGVPAAAENDAGVAALAEWRLGAGRGADALVVLTLGTGVGGGVVLAGRLLRGWAELGHVVVVADGPPCHGSCSGRGHLEALVSGTAADRAAEALWGPGGTAERLVERADGGDGEALAALDRLGRLLGAAIGSLVNLLGIRLYVVGGGFGTAAGEVLRRPALAAARREALAPGRDGLRIAAAELGPAAGLVGAGLLGFDALDGAP